MFNLMKMFNECKHEKVSYLVKASYCPDCGAYIENKFYIVRCSCCNIKRKGILRGEEIIAENTFCHNCGSDRFYIEELPSPNIFDLDYMVIKKEAKVFSPKRRPTCQIWVETPQIIKPKMLTLND